VLACWGHDGGGGRPGANDGVRQAALIGAAASLFSVSAMLLGLQLRGVANTHSGPDLVAIAAGGTAYVTLAALLGLGVGAAVRDPVVALACYGPGSGQSGRRSSCTSW